MSNTALTLQIGGDITNLRNELNKANALMGGFSSQVRSAGIALGLAFGAREVFRGLQQGIEIASNFEKTMSEVRAITGATGDDFKDLEKDALRLGASTKYTASQVGQLQVAYGRLGFSTKEILEATEATLNLAAATGEDLAKSADVAGSTVRGFELSAKETGRVVDVMAASFNKTALGLDNFTESMKYVAPVGNAAGATVEEVTAMLGVLADAGIRGSMAGTSLRKIFTDMTKDGRPLMERLAELAAKGITLQDSFDEVGRTAQTSLLILSKNTDKINNLSFAFEDAAGEAAKMASIMQDNLAGDVTKLSSAWEGLMIKMADTKPLRDATQLITGLINAFSGGSTSLEDAMDGAANAIKSVGNVQGFHKSEVWSTMIKTLADARIEMGKPIDMTQIEIAAEKYKLTSLQADVLRAAVIEANQQLSFQEQTLKDFNDFAKNNGYEDLTKAVYDYQTELYKAILAHQIGRDKDHPRLMASHNEQIAMYRRMINILDEYKTSITDTGKALQQNIILPGFLRPEVKRGNVDIGDEFYKGDPDTRDTFGINLDEPAPGVVKEVEFNEQLHQSLLTLEEDRKRQLDQMEATAQMAVSMGESIGAAFEGMISGSMNFAQALGRVTEDIITMYLKQSIAAMIATSLKDPSTPFPLAKIAMATAGIGIIKGLFGQIGAAGGGGSGGGGPVGVRPSEMKHSVGGRIRGYDLALVTEKESYRRSRVG